MVYPILLRQTYSGSNASSVQNWTDLKIISALIGRDDAHTARGNLGKRKSERITAHQHVPDVGAMLLLLCRNLLKEFCDLGVIGFDTPQLFG